MQFVFINTHYIYIYINSQTSSDKVFQPRSLFVHVTFIFIHCDLSIRSHLPVMEAGEIVCLLPNTEQYRRIQQSAFRLCWSASLHLVDSNIRLFCKTVKRIRKGWLDYRYFIDEKKSPNRSFSEKKINLELSAFLKHSDQMELTEYLQLEYCLFVQTQ